MSSHAQRRYDDPTVPFHVAPKIGVEFILQTYRNGDSTIVERVKVVRVIRQGTHEHGQGLVWTVDYEVDGIDEWDRPAKIKVMTWIMYDEHRREWADARLVQDEAAARGKPIYAAPSKEPPISRITTA